MRSKTPREGSSNVNYGVLDQRLKVPGVKGLEVADMSICPDNVRCNMYNPALLTSKRAAIPVAEDLGYSGEALGVEDGVSSLGMCATKLAT